MGSIAASPASIDGRHRRLLCAAMGRQEGALRSDRRQINGRGWTEPLLRFVQTYDEKPKRRLFELLKGQGMQMNQRVMFFSDGGTDIREVQLYLNPEAEHYLDWFHITMRLTVMGQYAKGLDTTQERRQEILKSLESVKHYLWHGNVVRARDKLEDLHGILDHGGIAGESGQKLRKALDEFDTYVVVNQPLIPNYG